MPLAARPNPTFTGISQPRRRHLGSVPRSARGSVASNEAQTKETLSPWGGRERPATAAEEVVFIDRLRQMTARPSQGCKTGDLFHRYDITAVVTALRNGVTVGEMFRSAPGLRPESVAAAYDHVERIRRAGVDAWRSLVADPTPATLLEVGEHAALVLPAVISRLRSMLVHHHPGTTVSIEDAVAAINAEILATSDRALELEYMLTDSADPAGATEAGALLVGDLHDGLWSLGSFLPPRVGTLVSPRLREMLDDYADVELFAVATKSRQAVA